MLSSGLLQELGDQGRPSGLMACPQTAAAIAVEVLVKMQQVAPVGVPIEHGDAAVHRPAAVSAAHK
jgi:hypothetical protein